MLNELCEKYHQRAIDAGWYKQKRTAAELAVLIASECFEIFESYRNNTLDDLCDKGIELTALEEEVADVAIRLFDMCGYLGIDLDLVVEKKGDYNLTRGQRHGGKLL